MSQCITNRYFLQAEGKSDNLRVVLAEGLSVVEEATGRVVRDLLLDEVNAEVEHGPHMIQDWPKFLLVIVSAHQVHVLDLRKVAECFKMMEYHGVATDGEQGWR